MCPHGLPIEAVHQLSKDHKDFREIPEGQRVRREDTLEEEAPRRRLLFNASSSFAAQVTIYWLRTCIEMGSVVPHGTQLAPAFRPLPFKLPLKAFAGVRLHCTQYKPATKSAIKTLVTLLGGIYTETLSRSNTHLLLQAADGDKFRMAHKFGVTTVTSGWLAQCALRGMPVGPEGYLPANMPTASSTAMVGAATQAAFPSQMGSTQVLQGCAGITFTV